MSSFNPLSPDGDFFVPPDPERQQREDAELVRRLTEAPARLSFHIDVSKVSQAEALDYLSRVKEQWRKRSDDPPGR